MGFNLGASNNTGKLNMNDFLGDEATVQNDEKEIPINLLVPWENQPFKMYSDFKMNELVESIREKWTAVPDNCIPRHRRKVPHNRRTQPR